MADPPPTPKDDNMAPKSGAFGGMSAQQSANNPGLSPFRLASTTARNSPFGRVAAEQPVIGFRSSTFTETPTTNFLGGFGGTQTTTALTNAMNNLPSITSNVFGNEFGTSNTTGFPIQQALIPQKGTATGFVAYAIEREANSETGIQHYQTITFSDPYKNYSLEELRLLDYEQVRCECGESHSVNTATTRKVKKTCTSLMCLKNTSTLIPSPKSIRIPMKQAMQLGRGVITIHVGDKEDMQSFTVHEALICTRSNFFRNTLSRSSKEAQEKTVNLSEDNPTIFALYEQLLYSGWLPSKSDTSIFDDIVKEYATLCSLYVLSSKIQDVDAKRVAIEALLEMSRTMMLNDQRTCPLLQHVEIIYHGTHGPCAARRLMVDIYTYRASEDWLEKTFPPDFVFDLAKNVLSKRRTTIDTTLTCKVSDYYDMDEVVEEKL